MVVFPALDGLEKRLDVMTREDEEEEEEARWHPEQQREGDQPERRTGHRKSMIPDIPISVRKGFTIPDIPKDNKSFDDVLIGRTGVPNSTKKKNLTRKHLVF